MERELKHALGAAIRAARNRAGLTQEELGAQIGKTPETVSNIERGKQTPTIETLAELARILKVPISELFDAVGDANALPDARRRSEARLREMVRQLDDDALTVVLEQVAAFARYANDQPSES
jgi:transcriptional regulator with XRE-family HTH domain